MEGFNDKEHEKISKSLSEKLDFVRKNMTGFTPELQEEVQEAIDAMHKSYKELQEKEKLGTITDLETEVMVDIDKKLKDLALKLTDTFMLLHQSVLKNATAIYNDLKEKAEKGDEQAKKAYEQLRASYQQMLKGNMDENRN